MANYKYSECPNCKSKDTNRTVYECTACGRFYGCWDKYGSGCWGTGEPCKNCGASGKYKQSGYITG